jgi:hypothetical protein
MADNVQLPPVTGSGGDVTAADEIGGVKFQRVKLIHGADGVNDGDVSSVNPFPVSDATINSHFKTYDSAHSAGDKGLPVLGDKNGVLDTFKMDASGNLLTSLPTGAATEATLVAIHALSQQIENMADSINTLVQFLYANSPRIDVANRMTVNNSEVTQPVSGTITANIGTGSLANITAISGQPQQYVGQDVPIYIYDNIKVT